MGAKKFNEAIAGIDAFVYSIIDARRKQLQDQSQSTRSTNEIQDQKESNNHGDNIDRHNDELGHEGNDVGSDLLSRYLSMKVDPTTGEPFTNRYLRDIITNFMIAGRDTTGILLTWTFYMLAIHPDVEKKVHS